MIEFPKRLSLARLPTPIQRLERFADIPEEVEIWVKRDDLTGVELTGNKIRKLEFLLADALDQGCDTLITCGGLQSNHCRATALIGARLGLKVHLLLRGDEPSVLEGNLFLDHLCGATVSYVPVSDWPNHATMAEELQDHYRKKSRKAYYIPVGGSDEMGLWGYIAACQELQSDFERLNFNPDYIVLATGSGGTQGGLVLGKALMDLSPRVVAFNVSDDGAYFDRKIRADVSLWKRRFNCETDETKLEIITAEGYLGRGYGVASDPVYDCIRDLARSDGIILDPVYTGKAFHGLVQELKRGADGQLPGARTILFIHTGGLFGVFPHAKHFKLD